MCEGERGSNDGCRGCSRKTRRVLWACSQLCPRLPLAVFGQLSENRRLLIKTGCPPGRHYRITNAESKYPSADRAAILWTVTRRECFPQRSNTKYERLPNRPNATAWRFRHWLPHQAPRNGSPCCGTMAKVTLTQSPGHSGPLFPLLKQRG